MNRSSSPQPSDTTSLKPCRVCEADCRPELFPDYCGDVDFQTTVWLCSQHKMFGGKCPSDTAYLTEEAWNTRQPQSPSTSLSGEMIEAGVDQLVHRMGNWPGDNDADVVKAIWLAMKAKEEASAQSPADEVERVARALWREDYYDDPKGYFAEQGCETEPRTENLDDWPADKAKYERMARAALSAIRNGDKGMRGLQTFANTVHETTDGRCPWCGSRDHWAGQVGLCCAPSSRAIAAALDTTKGGGDA